MQRQSSYAMALFLIAAAAISGCSRSEETKNSGGAPTTQTGAPGAGGAGGSLKIAVIPKGTTHAYWKSVQSGAEQAAKELNVEMVWKGPVTENDRASQIGIVQQFIAEDIGGIVLAPLDYEALAAPVGEATAKGTPVVIIDSAIKGTPGKDFASFVATNNEQAGVMGGETLAKILNDKGDVVLLRYMPGSASTDDREKGFLEAMAKHPDIHIISKDQYSGATQGEAQTASLNMLSVLQKAQGIFCPNESSTLGMLGALDQAQLAGKVKFVGFDATPELIDALKAKQIDALIAQDPRRMGYEGVKTLVAAIHKETVPPTIDTGSVVVTMENLNNPEIKKVLGE